MLALGCETTIVVTMFAIRFGEDLMSRVSYAMMNDNGAAEMTKAVRTALNGLLARSELSTNGDKVRRQAANQFTMADTARQPPMTSTDRS